MTKENKNRFWAIFGSIIGIEYLNEGIKYIWPRLHLGSNRNGIALSLDL